MDDISKLEQQANLLFDNVAGWENSTLQRIGKRIKKYGKLSLADVKSINNIAVVKQDMEAITKELAKVTGYNISQIEQISQFTVYWWIREKGIKYAEQRLSEIA